MLTLRRTPRSRVGVAALLISIESVVALVLAHLAAGGEAPAGWWMLAFGLPVYGASRLVLRRRASIRVLLPVLGATQVLGHAWLVALTPGAHAGHVHDAGPFLGLTGSMLAGHLAAAAVTGAMWALRRRAVDVLLQWSEPGLLPTPIRVQLCAATTVRPLLSRRHGVTSAPRGPPRLLAATA